MLYYFILSFVLLVVVSVKTYKLYPADKIARVNKHGDIYDVIGGDVVFLKFYDLKNNKWIYSLEVCDTDVAGIKGVRPRKFNRVDAILLGHKIDFDMFIHLHVNMVRSYTRNQNLK